MTVGQMIAEVYNELGESSDCDPYTNGVLDPGSAGYQRILNWINAGLMHVATYKFTNGRQLRFRELSRTQNLKSQVTTTTVVLASGGGTALTVGLASYFVDHLYENWVLEDADGNFYQVMSSLLNPGYPAPTLALDLELDTNFLGTVGDTLTLRRREYSIRTTLGPYDWTFDTAPLEIHRVWDNKQGLELTAVSDETTLYDTRKTVGDPTQFALFGQSIKFDVAPEDARWFSVSYFGMPPTLAAVADVPSLPVQFHEGIKLWALHLGFRQKEELDDAWKMAQNFTTFMATTRSTMDLEDARLDKGYSVDTGRM